MSAAEETFRAKEIAKPKSTPLLNRALDFLSSVRFGIVLLCALVALSMVGMLIIQQNVQGFDAYYASLTPAEKLVFGRLGFFDVYYSWYFKFLLLLLSLNIVLASIDRFPSAWSYIVRPKLDASRKWLAGQPESAVVKMPDRSEERVAETVKGVFEANGLKTRITEKKGSLYVFGERGKWNRLGAYVVHVALLLLFLGHFVALQTGFDADVRLTPDTNRQVLNNFAAFQKTDQIQLIEFNLDQQERFNVKLPFSITCAEIEQKLIDPKGTIDITNTLDWRTRIKIDDPEYGETVADVSLNRPFAYRGYRFFQASAITVGSARRMTLELKPEAGGAPVVLDLERNGSAELPDGTRVAYDMFLPDFVMQGSEPSTRTAEYNNPAAVLNVTPPNGGDAPTKVFAFANKLPDNAPINAPKAGYRWRMTSFEKSPLAHVLSIKYDPFNGAVIAWYFGGFGLIGALMFVFFMSHKRVWALVEKNDLTGGCEVLLGGNANRNQLAFGDKFKKIVGDLGAADAAR